MRNSTFVKFKKKGESIVAKEAYDYYRENSKRRNKKIFSYYKDYGRVTRNIWKKVAEASMEYESGVYAKNTFYFVPQVIANRPFIQLPSGKIKSFEHTNGDMYSPIFNFISPRLDHICWNFDGSFLKSYKERLNDILQKYAPKYYFMLNTLIKTGMR